MIYAIRGPVFGEKRFPKSYQKRVGMEAADFLHKNSMELVQILKDNQVLSSNDKVFELGSGPGRNLHYILAEYPEVLLYCSDLFYEESLSNMSNQVREKVKFIQGDSEDVVANNVIKGIDLFIVSDHLMHLQYDKADKIIKLIISLWKPKYVLLREIKEEHENRNHPRLFHNYSQFLDSYKIKFQASSKQNQNYFIWLLQSVVVK